MIHKDSRKLQQNTGHSQSSPLAPPHAGKPAPAPTLPKEMMAFKPIKGKEVSIVYAKKPKRLRNTVFFRGCTFPDGEIGEKTSAKKIAKASRQVSGTG